MSETETYENHIAVSTVPQICGSEIGDGTSAGFRQ